MWGIETLILPSFILLPVEEIGRGRWLEVPVPELVGALIAKRGVPSLAKR